MIPVNALPSIPTSSFNPVQQKQHTNISASQFTAPRATTSLAGQSRNINPSLQNVGQNSLVSNNMNGLLAQNSQYMQGARNRAMQTGNARGLLNSSMTAGAGEQAAIASAMPIAQADAATQARQSLVNQQYTNRANVLNAANSNQMAQFNTGQANSMSNANAARATQAGMQNAAQTNRVAQFNASQSNAINLANTDAVNTAGLVSMRENATTAREKMAQGMSLSRSAMSQANTSLDAYQNAWQTIQSTPTSQMTQNVKTQMMAQLDNIQRSRMTAISAISGVNLNWG